MPASSTVGAVSRIPTPLPGAVVIWISHEQTRPRDEPIVDAVCLFPRCPFLALLGVCRRRRDHVLRHAPLVRAYALCNGAGA